MIVTIEGFDGVGKTTLALSLANKLKFEYLKAPIATLFSVDEKTSRKIFNSVASFGDKYLTAMFLELNDIYALKSNREKNVVIDRHIVLNCQWNYDESTSSIFNDAVNYGGKPDLVIILSAHRDVLLRRLFQRDPEDKDIEIIKKISLDMSDSIAFLQRNGYNYVVIDTNNKTQEEVLSEAIEAINNTQLNRVVERIDSTGCSSLIDGVLLYKDDLRFKLLGDLDELNSHLGLIRSLTTEECVKKYILSLQGDIMNLSAYIADNNNEQYLLTIERLDIMDAEISKLDSHRERKAILVPPGSNVYSAHVDIARTVARRAERSVVSVYRQIGISPIALDFVNKLSTYLYALARSSEVGGE